MSTDTESLDADSFVDEGNREAGMEVNVQVDEAPLVEKDVQASEVQSQESAEQQVSEQETAKEQSATESSSGKEEASDDRSFLVPETEQQQEAERMVPLHVASDLRAKNRELKQQLDQARTRPAGEKADVGADPLEGLEDDDFLTAAQARAERIRNQAIGEQVRQDAEEQTAQVVQQEKLKSFLLESEKQARTDHPDFNAVMTAAEDYMSPDDFQAALRTRNPAKVLYAKAKQTIATLGIEVHAPVAAKQKQKQSQEGEAVQTDDEVYNEVFNVTPAT